MRIVESRLIAGDENIQIDDVTTIRYTLGSNFLSIENGDFAKVADRPAVSESATDGDPIFALDSGPKSQNRPLMRLPPKRSSIWPHSHWPNQPPRYSMQR